MVCRGIEGGKVGQLYWQQVYLSREGGRDRQKESE
jgi:hypothetical protein